MKLKITFQQGGRQEFERTGVYPEYLLFNIPETRQSWRIKIISKPQEGVLKSKDVPVYEYRFYGKCCSYRIIQNDGTFSDWIKPESMNFWMID